MRVDVLWGCLLLAACSREAGIEGLPKGATFPHVMVGRITISVEEGEPGVDDISEVNFGELKVDGTKTYMITVAGDVVRRAGITRNDLYTRRLFRVTLTGVDPISKSTGVPAYVVGELAPLD